MVGLSDVAHSASAPSPSAWGSGSASPPRCSATPQTLILDEPVNGLDLDGIRWIRALLRRLADEGRTVFLSSHLMSEMALTADHVIVIGRAGCCATSRWRTSSARPRVESVRVVTPEADRLGGAARGRGPTRRPVGPPG